MSLQGARVCLMVSPACSVPCSTPTCPPFRSVLCFTEVVISFLHVSSLTTLYLFLLHTTNYTKSQASPSCSPYPTTTASATRPLIGPKRLSKPLSLPPRDLPPLLPPPLLHSPPADLPLPLPKLLFRTTLFSRPPWPVTPLQTQQSCGRCSPGSTQTKP